MRSLLFAIMVAAYALPAYAQTVINVPPDPAPISVGADTTLNLLDGGELPADFTAHAGSVVNISGGVVGENFEAEDGSRVAITGGRLENRLYAREGSLVELSGGTYGDLSLWTSVGSDIAIVGGDFRIDGEELPNLDSEGATRQINVPAGSTFSGTLADGTPFAFAEDDFDFVLSASLTARRDLLPAIGPARIIASTDAIPMGLRQGQTLVVDSAAELPDDFNAGWGSTVEIQTGGAVGYNLEAAGATINMSGGETLGGLELFYGGVLNMTGGTLNSSNDVFSDGKANIAGGSVERIWAWNDAELNLSGDATVTNLHMLLGSSLTIADDARVSGLTFYRPFSSATPTSLRVDGGGIYTYFELVAGVKMAVTGGYVGAVAAGRDAELRVSGGRIGGIAVYDGGRAYISGGDFGVISIRVDTGGYAEISGGEFGSFTDIGQEFGVRDELAIVEISGGVFGQHFTVRENGRVAISGGDFGADFRVEEGGRVNVTGGDFGDDFTALEGSTVSIANATFSDRFTAAAGSSVTVTDSSLGANVDFSDGSIILHGQDIASNFKGKNTRLIMHGGRIGGGANLNDGSSADLTGVQVEGDFRIDGVELSVRGGALGNRFRSYASTALLEDVTAQPSLGLSGNEVTVTGGTFGPYARLTAEHHGQIRGATFSENATITGSFDISGSNFGDNLVIEGGSIVVDGVVGDFGRVVTGGEAIVAGGTVGNRFLVGDARLNMTGGTFGDELAVFGSEATLTGGTVGARMLLNGSQLHLIGSNFQLDGVPIEGLTPGVRTTLTDRDAVLTATLADGSPFDFVLDTSSSAPEDRILGSRSLVTLTLFDGLLGDHNADGVVDAADYTVWRDTLGQSVTFGEGADHDFSGVIDQGDYYVWRNHYGGALGPDGAPVPSPGAAVLLALGGAACCGGRPRRTHCPTC